MRAAKGVNQANNDGTEERFCGKFCGRLCDAGRALVWWILKCQGHVGSILPELIVVGVVGTSAIPCQNLETS